MEDLLLVLDEIDDLYSMAGLIWRPLVSFLCAVALFIATGFVFLAAPFTAEIIAAALVSLGVFEMLRQRRQNQAVDATLESLG